MTNLHNEGEKKDWDEAINKIGTKNRPEWEKELKRQCEIRKLPYSDVKYLVDEVSPSLLSQERERIVGEVENMHTNRYDGSEEYEHARHDVLSLIKNL